MPSFFRSAEDVRIFFLNETDTPEKKRQYSRLKTIFEQCVRRPGARGSFFFHRKSGSLGGAPILIFEPQGPVDRGIFQEGITRFGETLFGTFHCTATGYIELEVKKNLSDANALKYSRDIRKAIKRIAGIMQTGGDDRVQIITPREKARRAREAAEQKRREAEEARERRRRQAEQRSIKRALKKDRKAAAAQIEAEKARRAKVDAQKPPPAEEKKSPRQLRREKEEEAEAAQIERLQKEAEASEADGEAVEATAAAEDARDLAAELAEQLQQARSPARAVAKVCKGKNIVQLQAALFKLVAQGPHREEAGRLLARVRGAKPAQLDAIVSQWQRDEDERLAELRGAAAEAEAEALALEKLASRTEAAAMSAREEAANLKVSELQARLAAVEDPEAADALRDALAAAESARRVAEIAARQQDASRALRALRAGLATLEATATGDQIQNPSWLRKAMRSDPSMRKGLKRLRRAISGLRKAGARRSALTVVWEEHPDLLWAQATILAAI